MASGVIGDLTGLQDKMKELLLQQAQQELNQTADNIRMDQLKHLGKLVSDASSITQ